MDFCRIDGTDEKHKKLLIYANDADERSANCVTRMFKTKKCTIGPCIVAKRDIPKDEEITYSYGRKPYEWRTVHF